MSGIPKGRLIMLCGRPLGRRASSHYDLLGLHDGASCRPPLDHPFFVAQIERMVKRMSGSRMVKRLVGSCMVKSTVGSVGSRMV